MAKKNRNKPRRQQSSKASTSAPKKPKGPGCSWLFTALLALFFAVLFVFWRHGNNDPYTPTIPSFSGTSTNAATAHTSTNGFMGSESCATCHQKEYDVWKDSTHAKAGGKPGEVPLIARFDGTPLKFKDGTVIPTTNTSGNLLFIVKQNGLPSTEVQVDAVIGGGHMYGGGTQSFFQEFADGTVRFLPFDFIRKENLWFVQLRQNNAWVPITDSLSLASDLKHWPPHRILGTRSEFSNCQNCHGSQITTKYNLSSKRYQTDFTSLRINCESCHGPGQRHIDIVSKPGHERLDDIGMKPLETMSKDQSLQVCFQCHATKDNINEDNFLPGHNFDEFFSIKLPAMEETFEIDGRIREFSYQSPHLFSDCYLNGSMTCVDCHDPHSQGYRSVTGEALVGRFDDRQCTSCHASKAINIEEHTHHPAASAGSRCTSCHMPFLQHKGLGNQLKFERSDHAIPIPRPAFDSALGIENACQKCHSDQSIAWQEAQVREWYGEIKPHHTMIQNLIKAQGVSNPHQAAELLLDPNAKHPMAQITGMSEYLYRFLIKPELPVEPEAVRRLQIMAGDDDLDIKALALMTLHVRCDHLPEIKAFIEAQINSLPTDDDSIRNRWAVTASYIANTYSANGENDHAIRAYEKSLRLKENNVVVMSQLALAHLKSGNVPETIQWLTSAIKHQPHNAVLHFQLAQTYARQQQIPEAIRALEQGLQFAPNDRKAQSLLQRLQQ
jgi:tetratricopeptide (TPR) repeat protein